MSQENVELMRAWFDAWNATGDLDLSAVDPGLIYHPRADEPDPSPHVGRDAYEQLARGFIESTIPLAQVSRCLSRSPPESPAQYRAGSDRR